MTVKEFCEKEYDRIFHSEREKLENEYNEYLKTRRKGKVRNIELVLEDIGIVARKEAIKLTVFNALKEFPNTEPAEIWKYIYVAHVYHRSGETDYNKIKKISAADQSWKKSSGHAFESIIKDIANPLLKEHSLKIFLQKDLSLLLKAGNVDNEIPDLIFLNSLTKTNIFDLFIGFEAGDEKFRIFGCIQSKTSIRDRVTRDREPSINAMKKYFLSVAIVLDGDFLKLPKFKGMVNGETGEYDINGWHALYVFSNENKYQDKRIFTFDTKMKTFVEHMIKAADFWKKNRQWFDHKWKPDQ